MTVQRLGHRILIMLAGGLIAATLSGCQTKSLGEYWDDVFGPSEPVQSQNQASNQTQSKPLAQAQTRSTPQATAGATSTQQSQSTKPMSEPTPQPTAAIPGLDPENTLYMDLEYGRVVIKMLPDIAPKHVARIKETCTRRFL